MQSARTDPCPVMGLVEIAARLGVSKSRARQLAAEGGFPPPWRLSAGSVWAAEDVEAWIRVRRPPPAEGHAGQT
jgi:predicted DNA-binding transcriptional regulator AlpA